MPAGSGENRHPFRRGTAGISAIGKGDSGRGAQSVRRFWTEFSALLAIPILAPEGAREVKAQQVSVWKIIYYSSFTFYSPVPL